MTLRLSRHQPSTPEAPYARQFSAGTTVNTLTVRGPLMPSKGLAAPRCPDADQIRVLIPDVWERRRLRRRVHETNRQIEREISRQAGTGGPSTPEKHIYDGATL
jgi:hypothetical protein